MLQFLKNSFHIRIFMTAICHPLLKNSSTNISKTGWEISQSDMRKLGTVPPRFAIVAELMQESDTCEK